MKRYLLAVLTASAITGAIAASPKDEDNALSSEIASLMDNLYWRQMIGIALERGTLQARAKRSAGITDAQRQCVDGQYTEDAVLALIATSYKQVFSDASVVAQINQFAQSSGGRKFMASAVSKAEAGAKGAGAPATSTLMLSPAEKRYLIAFAASPAGKEYQEAKKRHRVLQREQLQGFASAVQRKCGIK